MIPMLLPMTVALQLTLPAAVIMAVHGSAWRCAIVVGSSRWDGIGPTPHAALDAALDVGAAHGCAPVIDPTVRRALLDAVRRAP